MTISVYEVNVAKNFKLLNFKVGSKHNWKTNRKDSCEVHGTLPGPKVPLGLMAGKRDERVSGVSKILTSGRT